ncbi:M18 family aminopeptidase [Fibrobacter sp. UWB3]|uniref:M18 family aminopeptidase n=1 Tax=Fibrobacter sp. UWB3 TaxID=1964357 RepID=UPI000B524765|nr:M18 family aminopeptidase [Fibrobacter sp. UWB3]OWV15966.1 M18 family aminopeptidase [Fibrobacter sp. UWB3]
MDFFEFLNTAVTPYHTVDALKSFFKANSFTEIELGANLEPAKAYFVCREASIIAFRTPQKWSDESKFKIALAHTDFPTLKISPNPDVVNAGVCTLHTEVYGSPLYTSWLDRDLGYAGMLAYVEAGSSTLKTKLFRGEKLFRIPQLAVHLNRGVNQDGLKVNPQIDFNALWACASDSKASENRKNLFVKALEKELPEGSRLIDFDVQLFDAQSANRGGFNDEWIYSGRLDNLSSCHAIAEAMVSAKSAESDCLVACFFNNEEVGSTTREGAASNFLKSVLDSIASLQNDCHPGVCEHDRAQAPLSSLASRLSSSIALSIDMAHAEHPNHTEKHELNHAPLLGKGIVLKTNSQKRYASDLMSSAQLRLLCEKAEIPLQVFIMRNDMPCGSTVGPTVSANLGIPTVDIGEPMLSMHSIREMMAASDHEDMIKLVKALYCYS